MLICLNWENSEANNPAIKKAFATKFPKALKTMKSYFFRSVLHNEM